MHEKQFRVFIKVLCWLGYLAVEIALAVMQQSPAHLRSEVAHAEDFLKELES